jgi:hypothetical protein
MEESGREALTIFAITLNFDKQLAFWDTLISLVLAPSAAVLLPYMRKLEVPLFSSSDRHTNPPVVAYLVLSYTAQPLNIYIVQGSCVGMGWAMD